MVLRVTRELVCHRENRPRDFLNPLGTFNMDDEGEVSAMNGTLEMVKEWFSLNRIQWWILIEETFDTETIELTTTVVDKQLRPYSAPLEFNLKAKDKAKALAKKFKIEF